MEAGRKLREEQYAALKDKEWEDTLMREAELHRCTCNKRKALLSTNSSRSTTAAYVLQLHTVC